MKKIFVVAVLLASLVVSTAEPRQEWLSLSIEFIPELLDGGISTVRNQGILISAVDPDGIHTVDRISLEINDQVKYDESGSWSQGETAVVAYDWNTSSYRKNGNNWVEVFAWNELGSRSLIQRQVIVDWNGYDPGH